MESPLEITIIIEHGEKIIIFKECHNGLYYHVVGSDNSTDTIKQLTTTICCKLSKATNHTFAKKILKSKSDIARQDQQGIGWTSNTKFKYIIKKKLICNIDINLYGIDRAEIIY